jgi:violaxanthin de-epoxidase
LFQKLAEGPMEVKHDFMNFLQGLSKEMELLDQLNMEATEVEKVFSRAPTAKDFWRKQAIK